MINRSPLCDRVSGDLGKVSVTHCMLTLCLMSASKWVPWKYSSLWLYSWHAHIVHMYTCTHVLSHQSAVMGVAFSPSGEFFSSVGADEEVSLSSIHNMECEK